HQPGGGPHPPVPGPACGWWRWGRVAKDTRHGRDRLRRLERGQGSALDGPARGAEQGDASRRTGERGRLDGPVRTAWTGHRGPLERSTRAGRTRRRRPPDRATRAGRTRRAGRRWMPQAAIAAGRGWAVPPTQRLTPPPLYAGRAFPRCAPPARSAAVRGRVTATHLDAPRPSSPVLTRP